MTFTEAERALDAGELEMQRPWGDWVTVRRDGSTQRSGQYRYIEVLMEAKVAARLSTAHDRFGQPYLRVRP